MSARTILRVAVSNSQQWRPAEHAEPKDCICETWLFPEGLVVTHPDQWQLEHLQRKQVQTDFPCHHHHDQLVHTG